MKIENDQSYALVLSEVQRAIGIKTATQGTFGILENDGGIHIIKGGRLLWSSTSGDPRAPSVNPERPFTARVNEILRFADQVAEGRRTDYLGSLHLLLGMLDAAESQAGEVLANVGCVLAVRTMASSMADQFERHEQGAAKESAAPTAKPKEERWNVHDWQKTCICKNCGMEWTAVIEHGDCSGDDPGEHALVQLASCLVAAEGNAVGANDCAKGDYGWSPAFQAVKELWNESEDLANTLRKMRGDAQVRERRMRNLDGSLEIAVERNQKLRRDLEKALKTIDELRKQ